MSWHVAKIGDRWAALEPMRQGVRHTFGGFQRDIARGLAVRCDWGPQYIADAWIQEVKWLGITISPSYVGEPECNGVIERFIRTLKEQCLYLHHFQTLEEAHRKIAAFVDRYNHEWLIERLGYRTPAGARAEGCGIRESLRQRITPRGLGTFQFALVRRADKWKKPEQSEGAVVHVGNANAPSAGLGTPDAFCPCGQRDGATLS